MLKSTQAGMWWRPAFGADEYNSTICSGSLKGQRLQHQRIDGREDRRRRADAKCQCQKRGGGDPLGLSQETEGVTQFR